MSVSLLFTPLGQQELQFVNRKIGVIDTLTVHHYQRPYFIDQPDAIFCNRKGNEEKEENQIPINLSRVITFWRASPMVLLK